ncbi:MAG: hypothetical protein NUV53_04605 [Patescibacteria group bacterium]|nr:hypothetical protein [Patescibacteria group bacterium]
MLKTIFKVAVFAISIGTLTVPSPAHAGWLDFGASVIFGATGGAIAWITYIISYIITAIVGLFTALIIYSIGVVLQLNTNIVNAVAVQEGFKVTLSIANLGFVLGIIIIAIATIIRYEHYGIKHLLVKLITAALLVNFSLVIGGSILNFADQLSNVFLTAFPGGGGDENALSKFHNFSKSFGGAFSPQRALLNPTIKGANSMTSDDLQRFQGAGSVGQSLGEVFTPLLNLIFTIVILISIFITVCVFFFMLLIRYIYLGILFILMPLVWLMWVFPLTEHLWKQWWGKFLKWTFFAPISLFFLWLVIITSETMNRGAGDNPLQGLRGLGYTASDSSFVAGLSSFVGSLANQVVGTFLQMAVLVGLSIGGLIAAEKFSIMGSHAAMGTMKGLGKWAQGYVGKRAKQTGGKIAQRMGLGNAATALQQKGLSLPTNIASGRGRVLRTLAKPLNGLATAFNYSGKLGGRALQAGVAGGRSGLISGGEADVKDATKGLTTDQQANLISTMTAPQRIALTAKAMKEGWLEKIDSKYYGPAQKEMYKSYGQEKTYNDVYKATAGAGEKKHYFDEIEKGNKDTIEHTRAEAEKLKEEEIRKKSEDAKTKEVDQALRNTIAPSSPYAQAAAKRKWIDEEVKKRLAHTGPNNEIREAGNRAVKDSEEEIKKAGENAVESKKRGENVMVDEIDSETGKLTGRKVNAQEKLKEIDSKLVPDLKKGDKAQYKEIFGDKPAFGLSAESVKMMGSVFAEKIAYSNQQLVPNIISKMNAKQLQGFSTMYKKILKDGKDSTGGDLKNYIEKGEKNFEKILAHNMTSHAHEEEDHGGAHEEENRGGGASHSPAPEPAPAPSGGGGDASHH